MDSDQTESDRSTLFEQEASETFHQMIKADDFCCDWSFKDFNRKSALTLVSVLSFETLLGSVAPSVTCLAADMCLTADPGVTSWIPALYHTYVELDHEVISSHSPPFR